MELGKPIDDATTRRLLEIFLYRDSILALAVFYFLIDPSTYIPKPGTDFSLWNWPITKLEFDHLQVWRYLHEGGESKYSQSRTNILKTWADKGSEVRSGATNSEANSISGRNHQYRVSRDCDYSMKMCLPTITNHHIPRLQSRNITLLRRNVKKTVTNLKTDLKETTVDWIMSLVNLD